jgi:hypothetical protein
METYQIYNLRIPSFVKTVEEYKIHSTLERTAEEPRLCIGRAAFFEGEAF